MYLEISSFGEGDDLQHFTVRFADLTDVVQSDRDSDVQDRDQKSRACTTHFTSGVNVALGFDLLASRVREIDGFGADLRLGEFQTAEEFTGSFNLHTRIRYDVIQPRSVPNSATQDKTLNTRTEAIWMNPWFLSGSKRHLTTWPNGATTLTSYKQEFG